MASSLVGLPGGGFPSLGQGDDDVHVVDGEEAGLPADHSLVPVLVDLVGEDDEVALLKPSSPAFSGSKLYSERQHGWSGTSGTAAPPGGERGERGTRGGFI